ncbi:MAG TPA: PDZ domain-containing protein [Acidimicrobiales bacterium]|nr:PDZ domain-containing protein [Acidimicrobiales bacterium]
MDSGGPFTFGDVPDDAEGSEDEEAHRGWIAPEDRLWRHPSEVNRGAQDTAESADDRPSTRNQWRERRTAIAAGTLGAAAVAAAAAAALTLAQSPPVSTATRSFQAVETSLVTDPSMPVSAAPRILQLVSALRPSLVELVPAGADHRSPATGVVLPGGALVVTAASAAAGVSSLDVITSTGRRMQGRVLATDPSSGIAVVKTAGGLAPASFGDTDVTPGDLTVAACMSASPPSSSVPTTDVALSMVEQIGLGQSSSDGIGLMDSIAADTPLNNDWGGVLIDGQGDLVGILGGRENAGATSVGLFVPASLALGVAQELASLHRVEHGWIGVSAQDAPGGTGAVVQSVFPSSPAADAGIEPGDVVKAINSYAVSSHVDLEARLYVIPPGSVVMLTVVHSGSARTVSIALASDPGG